MGKYDMAAQDFDSGIREGTKHLHDDYEQPDYDTPRRSLNSGIAMCGFLESVALRKAGKAAEAVSVENRMKELHLAFDEAGQHIVLHDWLEL